MPVLGYNTIATAATSTIEDGSNSNKEAIGGTAFAMSEWGECTQMVVYLDFSIAARQSPRWNIKCAIYEYGGGGGPHTFVEQTDVKNLGYGGADGPATNGWYTFTFDATVTLENGVSYLLVAWAEQDGTSSTSSKCRLVIDNDASYSYEYEQTPYSASWPDPWDPPAPASSLKNSVYINYTAIAAPGQIGILACTGAGR